MKSRDLRANVMIVENRDLVIRAKSDGYRDDELELRWRKGQGVAGEAWQSNETLVAPEDTEIPVSLQDLETRSRPWSITRAQGRATLELQSIVSTPIHHPSNRRIIGVLNFDDRRPLSDSLLDSHDVRATVEQLADLLAPRLIEAGYVTN